MNSTFMDYPEHERTYRAFARGAKWVTLAVALVVIVVVFVLI